MRGMYELLLALAPLHLGGLHGYEKVLVLVLAFGPFLVLAGVVYVLRRRDLAGSADPADSAAGDQATRKTG